jgi:membrane-bound metal-dependent hydrolase YbcI (DUF457 family)
LFLLGHACWAYLTGRLVSLPFGLRPNLYLLLILGMLPDIDLILGSLDVAHRTVTHSVIFWSLIFIPFFVKYKKVSLPYFVATTQHILIGDMIVGRTDIFWPVADLRIGLGLPILSPLNLLLEAAGLAIFVVAVVLGKDRSHIADRKKSASLALLVVIPLATFVILSSNEGLLTSFLLEQSDARFLERDLPSLLDSRYLQIALAMHLSLIVFIAVHFLTTSKRTFRRNPRSTTHA